MVAYAALLAVAATFVQAWAAFSDLKAERASGLGDYWAAVYLRSEVGFWHPIRRVKRSFEVRRLLADDPALKARLRRIGLVLWSWEALCVASGLVAWDAFAS